MESVRRYEAKRRGERLAEGLLCDLPAWEKRCSGCGKVKTAPEFSTKRTTRDGLHSQCRACNVLSARLSAARNPDKVRKHRAGWKKRNPAKVKAQDRLDKKRAYARRGEKIRVKVRAWAAANREKIRAYRATPEARMLHRLAQQRRMARMAGAANDLTREQWEKRLAQFDGRCAYCEAPWEDIDHIVPVVRGGGLTLANVLPACDPCNTAKNARAFAEFCAARGLDAARILAQAAL